MYHSAQEAVNYFASSEKHNTETREDKKSRIVRFVQQFNTNNDMKKKKENLWKNWSLESFEWSRFIHKVKIRHEKG